MKSATVISPAHSEIRSASFAASGDARRPVSTRFGELVDVRNRGTLRLSRLVGIQVPGQEAPAVVRMWSGEHCRELTAHQARALAAQLLEAAGHAERQNAH